MTRHTIAFFLLGPALLGLGVLAGPLPAEPEPLLVDVRPLEGPIVRGPLAALTDDDVRVANEVLPLAEVRSITFPRRSTPPAAQAAHLRAHLVAGERVLGTFGGSIEDGIVLESPTLGRVELLFDHLAGLVAVPAAADSCFEPEARHPPVEGEDVIYVEGGDAFQGLLVSVDDQGFELEDERGRTERVAWSAFRVLHLSNEKPPPAKGIIGEIETHDGSRLLASPIPSFEGTHLGVSLLSAREKQLQVPTGSVRRVSFEGGAFDHATRLPFTSTFRTPYGEADDDGPGTAFRKKWFGARVDRRPTGCPLRLKGVEYAHGFAVHAHSTIRLPLARAYGRFESLFGVDDEAAEVKVGGIVDARVVADGETLWEAKGVKAGERPRRVGPLDVTGVEELVLEVTFGAEGYMRDRATWAEPILVRAAP